MQRSKVVVKGGRAVWLAAAALAVAAVGALNIPSTFAQDAPPPANERLSDTWQGDTLNPKWNVTVLGDAQDQESAVEVENGTLRITAGGSDIWNDNDNGVFIWQPANGDFQITLEHRSLDRTDASAKAGIMVRASLDRTAANSFLMVMPKGGALQSRVEAGDVSGPGSGCPGEECNPWGDPVEDDPNRPVILQRLTRIGNQIKGERSYDEGKTWVGLRLGSIAERDQAEIELPDDVLVGIAMTSHNAGLEGQAVMGPITFNQIAARPTDNGLVALTAVDADGNPVPDVGIEVQKENDILGTTVGEVWNSNTASFFLPPGTYTARAAEDDYFEAGPPVQFEIKTGVVEILKVLAGAEK